MEAQGTPDFVELTSQLLSAISRQDWDAYASMCAPDMTCFEPEARGALVVGLPFHHEYFTRPCEELPQTICSPNVRMLGPDCALICFTRLVQRRDEAGKPFTDRYEESRVWQKQDSAWKLVHLHRSAG
jgi:ketosteroid isomerase-like protein